MTTFEPALRESNGASPFFIFADHASNHLPAEYQSLGLPEDILQTHIAWDIGAADLTRGLLGRLGGEAVFCPFSRLLLDPNRSMDREDLIPWVSDQIPIPGNQALGYEERERRIHTYFEPYHDALDTALDKHCAAQPDPFVVSIHSYTPRLVGAFADRPWQVGVLWRHDEASARRFMAFLRDRTDWQIGDNEPYDARQFNYTVDRQVAPRRLPHLTLEIRQDLLQTPDQIDHMADVLADGIRRCHRAAYGREEVP